MSTTIETLLTRNLHEVFGEPDPAKRAVAIQALYAPDSVSSDPHGHHVGHRALEEAVTALHAMLPGHVFTVISGPDALQDSGRLAWAFGPPEDPRRVTGQDVIVAKDGRIAALYTFVDAVAPRADLRSHVDETRALTTVSTAKAGAQVKPTSRSG